MSRRTQTVPRRSYPWSTIDPDRRNTILIMGGISLIVIVSLLLAGYGYYHEKVAPMRETVLRVGDRSWTVADLERRTEASIKRNQLDPNEMTKHIEDTLTQINEEELVRQAARLQGITASEEEILEGYKARFGLPPEAPRDLIALNLRSELRLTGLKLEEFEDIIRAQVLDKKMNDKVRETIPATAPHVNLGMIQLSGQGKALEIRQKILEETESFNVVAARDSVHKSKDKAGDVGWVPRQALPKELADVAFSRDELFLSDVIETPTGFFILAVRGKEDREVSEENQELIVQQARSEQLEKATFAAGVAIDLTQGQERRIAINLGAGQAAPGG